MEDLSEEARAEWLQRLASLPTADEVQRNRRMHQNQRGPVTSHERVTALSGIRAEADLLAVLQENQNELLDDQLISPGRALSRGDWLPERRLAQVSVCRGPMFQLVGFTHKDATYLYPEEALFALETGHLELMHEGLPVSIQLAYSLLLNDDDLPYSTYRVYAHLLRGGYNVYVHKHHQTMLQRTRLSEQSLSSSPGASPRAKRPLLEPCDDSPCTTSATPVQYTGVSPAAGDVGAVLNDDSKQLTGELPCQSGCEGEQLAASVRRCPQWIMRNVHRLMARGEQRLLADSSPQHGGLGHGTGEDPSALSREQHLPAENGDGDGEVSEMPAATHAVVSSRASFNMDLDELRHAAPNPEALLQRSVDVAKEDILEKLNIFAAPPKCKRVNVTFDLEVYNHRPQFAKMSPGNPDYYVCVSDGLMSSAPSLTQLTAARLAASSSDGTIPIRWAVAAENRMHFYSLDSFALPTLLPA